MIDVLLTNVWNEVTHRWKIECILLSFLGERGNYTIYAFRITKRTKDLYFSWNKIYFNFFMMDEHVGRTWKICWISSQENLLRKYNPLKLNYLRSLQHERLQNVSTETDLHISESSKVSWTRFLKIENAYRRQSHGHVWEVTDRSKCSGKKKDTW